MNGLELLRIQAAFVDDLMTQTIANVTAEQAVWRPPESTENPIANKILHVYYVEDHGVQSTLLNKPLVFEVQGWKDRVAFDPTAPWSGQGTPNLDASRAYAAAVRAQTVAALETLDPAILDREIDSFLGRGPLAALMTVFLVAHKGIHLGEISALLGSQGVKGFPF